MCVVILPALLTTVQFSIGVSRRRVAGMDSSGVFTGGPVSGYAAGDRSSVFSEPRRPADRDDDDVSDAGSSDTNGAPASRRPSVASWRRVTADTTAEATGRTAARGGQSVLAG